MSSKERFQQISSLVLGDNALSFLHAYVYDRLLHLAGVYDDDLAKLLKNLLISLDHGALAYHLDEASALLLRNYPMIVGSADHLPLVLENNHLYLRRHWLLECEVRSLAYSALVQRAGVARLLARDDGEDFLSAWQLRENATGFAVSDALLAAGRAIVYSDLLVLSGGPGSGKTTSLKRILILLNDIARREDVKLSVLFAAPTAKAVARMNESIGDMTLLTQLEPTLHTLHKALGYRMGGSFSHGLDRPWGYDLVVVDEMSMVDIYLFKSLLSALKNPSKLILIGDANQLASVESGAVLEDIVAGRHLKDTERTFLLDKSVVFLEGSKRSEVQILDFANHFLARNEEEVLAIYHKSAAHLVASAESIICHELKARAQDFYRWVAHQYSQDARQTLGAYAGDGVLSAEQVAQLEELFTLYESFVVISPIHAGSYGVQTINEQVGKLMLKQQAIPIVLTVNQPALALSNGDRGMLLDFEGVQYAVFKLATGGFVLYLPSHLQGYESAYAITVHKSQGSEYSRVAIVLPENAQKLLENRLVYTALTRAKTQVILFCNPHELHLSLQKNLWPRTSQLRNVFMRNRLTK
jgi:exodeoxyribonuclease V alpha subunit